jgi:2'-hydroxyisoflavone reductase
MVRISRRSFVWAVGALVAAMGMAPGAWAQSSPAEMSPEELAARLKRGLEDYTGTPKAAKPLKILFLGGTGFLGPHAVNYALARGHEVSLFNRGNRNEAMFPHLEEFIGNRDPNVDEGLKPLEAAVAAGRKWDVVVDTSGYVPRVVSASAELLNDAAEQYIFISSISVYADASPSGITEDAPVATMEDETDETVNQYYGALKALCEQAAERAFPGKATNIRPGLIVGPKDPTNRFGWWPARVAKGGKVLAPPAADPVQVIDVRDLAEFIVKSAEQRVVGVYNAVGPDRVLTVGEMLAACKKVSGSDAEFVHADAAFLAEHDVQAWRELPVWTEPGSPFGGFGSVSNARAVAAGMTFRSIEDTCRATLEWWNGISEAPKAAMWDPAQTGHMTAEREAEIIAAWEAKQAAALAN